MISINGLRETLKRLEDEGMCYTDYLGNDVYVTLWVDEDAGDKDIYYEYKTDDLYVYVDDLTDEDLKNVVIKDSE